MIDVTLDAHCWKCFNQNFSQISKSNFLESKKWLSMLFFLLTAGDALRPYIGLPLRKLELDHFLCPAQSFN